MSKNIRQNHAKILRTVRKLHRTTGVLLFVFFFIIAVTGLLLGWKKHSGGILLSDTRNGSSTDFHNWLSLDSLHKNAIGYLRDSVSADLSASLDRVDVRKHKGTVKFVFEKHFTGLQLDGSTGELLLVEKRRSDYIEKLHDGSILDFYFQTGNGLIKLIYTTIMGLALLLFTITGFWLWYGPRRMRR